MVRPCKPHPPAPSPFTERGRSCGKCCKGLDFKVFVPCSLLEAHSADAQILLRGDHSVLTSAGASVSSSTRFELASGEVTVSVPLMLRPKMLRRYHVTSAFPSASGTRTTLFESKFG